MRRSRGVNVLLVLMGKLLHVQGLLSPEPAYYTLLGVNCHFFYIALFVCILVTLAGLSACQPKEVDLPFETIERRDASGTGQVYKDKSPGLIPYFCAKPGGFYSIVQTEGISILQREQICPDFDIIGKLL